MVHHQETDLSDTPSKTSSRTDNEAPVIQVTMTTQNFCLYWVLSVELGKLHLSLALTDMRATESSLVCKIVERRVALCSLANIFRQSMPPNT